MLLRTGKTPSGTEAAGHIRRLVRQIRRHWPTTHITIRGDGHYGRPEVMAFCEAHGVDYVLGLPTNRALHDDGTLPSGAMVVSPETLVSYLLPVMPQPAWDRRRSHRTACGA